MSIENRTVAEFYVRLWPWIDHSKPVRLMLDDPNAPVAHPDMCFSFAGSVYEFRVEFKILHQKGKNKGQITPTDLQLRTWNIASAAGAPHMWVARVGDSDEYLVWLHDDPVFRQQFATRATAQTSRTAVKPPNVLRVGLAEAFISILQNARKLGFLQ